MDGVLDEIVALIAVLASVAGLLVTLEQLTLRSRMRRLAEWSKELSLGEQDRGRRELLMKMRIWATAQVVASALVPGRFFVESALWTVLASFIVIQSADSRNQATSLLFAFVALWLTYRRGVRMYFERYRILSEYRRGGSVKPPKIDLLHQMEGGSRIEFLFGALLATAVCAISFSVALVLGGSATAAILLIVLGLGLAGIALSAIRTRTPEMWLYADSHGVKAVREAGR